MEWYAIINRETGRINQSSMCGLLEEAQRVCNESERAVHTGDRFSAESYYINVDTDEAEERPETSCTPSKLTVEADGSDTVTLSQMRDGTRLQVSGPVSARLTVSGDNATERLTFTTSGKYTLTATAPWPAIPETIEIEAL